MTSESPKRWKLSTISTLAVLGLYLLGSLLLVILVNVNIKKQALVNAERYSGMILDHNVASHAFYNNVMKTKLYKLFEDHYVDPEWMSATYVLQSIAKDYDLFNEPGFSYKEASVNARNPKNEADATEHAFIERCNAEPDLERVSEIDHINDEPFFVTLRCGQQVQEDCLFCHGDPGDAPLGIVERYGPEAGFGLQPGTTASAISIRIPLALAYAEANLFSLKLSATLLAILLVIFAAQMVISRQLLFAPINAIRHEAHKIAHDPAALGDTLPLPNGLELAEMVEAFNQMSINLRHHTDHQEATITDRTAELEGLQHRTKLILNTASEGILGLSPEGTLTFVNRSALNMLGLDDRWDRQTSIFDLLVYESRKSDHADVGRLIRAVFETGLLIKQQEAAFYHQSGRSFPVEFSCAPIRDNGTAGAVLSFNDITRRKRSEKEIQNLAFYDQLTELPNRTLFYDRLTQQVAVAKRDMRRLALMFLDLDDFKVVNDTLGHAAGDEFLKVIGGRLKEGSRQADTVARLGGDEFVWFGEILDRDDAAIIARKFLESLSRPVRLGDLVFSSSASIGIALFPECADNVVSLMKWADSAMYMVKRHDKNAYAFWDEADPPAKA